MRALLAAFVAALSAWRVGVSAAHPPAPGPSSSAYTTEVRRAIDGAWKPDDILRARGPGGSRGPWVVTLRISVAADGAPRDVIVESSSGLPPLDDEAVRAVRTLPAFPPPPAALVDPASSTFTFPYTFVHPGWPPPRFAGDPLVRTPQTRSWELGSSMDVERRTTARRGTTSVAAQASYQRTTFTVTAARRLGAIGLVELQLPVAMIRYREAATNTRTDATGVGDASLHLHRSRRSGRWSSDYFFGLRLPTGAPAATPQAGDRVPAVVQLGAGTLDPEWGACLGFAVSAAVLLGACDHGRFAVYANKHDYREAYEFHGRLFLAGPLFAGRASVQAGVLHETRGAARWQGADLPSTGHRTLFAEASAWLHVVRGLALRATIELPVYANVDGPQLADTLRVMAGVSYDFDRL